MEINLLFILISIISITLSLTYEFDEYYSKKTLDEIRHIILSLEQYLSKYSKIDTKQYSLNQMNRNELTVYTKELVDKYGKEYLPTLEEFIFHTTIYPLNLNVDDIIKKGEKHDLISWAFNAEKYDRDLNNHSDYIGGIGEYAHLLSRNDLIAYINNTISNHNELRSRDVFDKEILNIRYDIPTIIELLRESSLDELRGYYYQLGVYLSEKTGGDNVLDHEILFEDIDESEGAETKKILTQKIYEIVKKNEELKAYDTFYEYIIHKNLSYTFPETIVSNLSKLDNDFLFEYVSACVEYHSQYQNTQPKMFRNLTDYIKKIPKRKIMKYILKEIKEFPELTLVNFKEEFTSNQLVNKLNQFSNNLIEKKRSDLIQIYLDLQYVLNNTDNYNNNLGKIFRMKDIELRVMINEEINSQEALWLYLLIEQMNSVSNESLMSFIKRYPRIALKYWYSALINYLNEQSNHLFENNMSILTTEHLIDEIVKLCAVRDITSIDEFRKKIDQDKYSPLYGGVIDYLKVINIKVLLIWLRKFEEYHRSQNRIANIQGGCNDYHSNLTKIDVIDMIMTYLTIYPQFQDSIIFDQFTGSRFQKLYHKRENISELSKIASLMDGYRRRMNPQIDYGKLFYEYITEVYITSKEKKYANEMMFFIFTVFTFHPQLNNVAVYNKVELEVNYFQTPFAEFLAELNESTIITYCQQMERYTNAIYDLSESHDFSSHTKVSLILYLTTNYKINPQLKEKNNLFRLFNDQIDYLYWNIDSYINRQNKISLIRIIDSIDHNYNPEHKENNYDPESEDTLRKIIIDNMTHYSELKEYDFFNKIVDTISVNDNTIELYNAIKDLNRSKLTMLALTAEFIYSLKDKFKRYKLISNDLYTVTNNELIRYILYGREDAELNNDFTYIKLLLKSNSFDLNHCEDDLINIFSQ